MYERCRSKNEGGVCATSKPNERWEGEFLCICVYLTFYSKIDHIDKLGSTDNKEIKNNSDI